MGGSIHSNLLRTGNFCPPPALRPSSTIVKQWVFKSINRNRLRSGLSLRTVLAAILVIWTPSQARQINGAAGAVLTAENISGKTTPGTAAKIGGVIREDFKNSEIRYRE